ncbi:hypothetical protein FF1_020078 [Malus domestica]
MFPVIHSFISSFRFPQPNTPKFNNTQRHTFDIGSKLVEVKEAKQQNQPNRNRGGRRHHCWVFWSSDCVWKSMPLLLRERGRNLRLLVLEKKERKGKRFGRNTEELRIDDSQSV